MAERVGTPTETHEASPHATGLLGRMKQFAGLGPKEEEPHEPEIMEESVLVPSAQPVATKDAAEEASREPTIEAPPPTTTDKKPSRVEAQKLLKAQEVEAGMVRPQYTPSGFLYTGRGPEAVTADLEAKGFIHQTGPIRGAATSVTATAGDIMHVEARPVPSVAAHGPATPAISRPSGQAAAAGAGKVQEVEVRPGSEVAAPSAAEVAGMKAGEHALLAEESRRRAEEKRRELQQLKYQAHTLEHQSAALLREAESEKGRVDVAMRKVHGLEFQEWKSYQAAEKAERERRAVVERAKPAARTADHLEHEALHLKQYSQDAEFHAKVLENRARALLKESEDMAQLSLDKAAEATSVAGQLGLLRQEITELKAQINTQAARDLPSYIEECNREIGALAHRVAQLREEISWAEGEIRGARVEADTWRRIVVSREGVAARLLLQLRQLEDDSREARHRSVAAAQEALAPTELADMKYTEAAMSAAHAAQLEEDARAAQAEAIEVVKAALGPEQERQRALREAAAAEAAGMALQAQAEIVEGKAKRSLYEAEVKMETAAVKEEEVVRREEELVAEKGVATAERRMAESYTAQQKEHRPIAVPTV